MNALYEALQTIVVQYDNGIKILHNFQVFCQWFKETNANTNDISVMMFFNLMKREATYWIKELSDEYSDSYTLALAVYALLFGKEKLSYEKEKIMLEHIEFIIALLQKKQIIDSNISYTNTKYISDLRVAVSTTLRRKGTRILSNVKTFRALLRDFMGNFMTEEIDSFCDFIERVEERNIDYRNDLKFNIPILFTALQENKMAYIPLQNEYENIISEYMWLVERLISKEPVDDNSYGEEKNQKQDATNKTDDVGYLKNMAVQAYNNNDINNALSFVNKALSIVQNDWELFYLKALCLEANEDYIGALFEIDNALKYAPNVAYLHRLKARCLIFTGDYLNAVNSSTKAIDLYAQSKKHEECKNFSLWLLNAVDMHFKYFAPTFFDDMDYYTTHITCFNQLANLEYAPESIKNTYRKYKQATIDAFKKAIKHKNEDMFGGYSDEKILEECNQFLSHPHIDNNDKKEIFKTVQGWAKYSDMAKQMLETYHFLAEDSSDSEQKASIDSYSSPQFSPILYDDEFDDDDDFDDVF